MEYDKHTDRLRESAHPGFPQCLARHRHLNAMILELSTCHTHIDQIYIISG